jgi:hypothetical protein
VVEASISTDGEVVIDATFQKKEDLGMFFKSFGAFSHVPPPPAPPPTTHTHTHTHTHSLPHTPPNHNAHTGKPKELFQPVGTALTMDSITPMTSQESRKSSCKR